MNSKMQLRNLQGQEYYILPKGKKTVLCHGQNEIVIAENILCYDATITGDGTIYAMITDGLTVQFCAFGKNGEERKTMEYPFGGNNFKIIMAALAPIVFFTAVEGGRTGIYMHFISGEQKPRLIDKCMGGKLPFSSTVTADGDIDIVYIDSDGYLVKYRYKWSIKEFTEKIRLLPPEKRYFSPTALFYGSLHIVTAVKEKELSSIIYINPEGEVKSIYKGAPSKLKLVLYRVKEDIFASWDQHGIILRLNLKTLELSEGKRNYKINEYIRIREPEETEYKNITACFGVIESKRLDAPLLNNILNRKEREIRKPFQIEEGREVMQMAGVLPEEISKEQIDLTKLKIKIDLLEKKIQELERKYVVQ